MRKYFAVWFERNNGIITGFGSVVTDPIFSHLEWDMKETQQTRVEGDDLHAAFQAAWEAAGRPTLLVPTLGQRVMEFIHHSLGEIPTTQVASALLDATALKEIGDIANHAGPGLGPVRAATSMAADVFEKRYEALLEHV